MIKKSSLALLLIFCALLAQAQDNPASWESDPLDVLESKPSKEAAEPPVPEFEEIPDSSKSAPSTDDQELSLDEPTPQKGAEHPTEQADVPPTEIAPEPKAVETAPAPTQQADVPESTPFQDEVQTATSAAPSEAPFSGEPDFKKEAEFHRIYKKYNEQPTSVEAWEQAVGSRSSQNYSIQKGDTLSDISTTFFNDTFYWPKIWSLNNETIGNPHQITPGMNIRFYPGSVLDAPTVAVVAENAVGGGNPTMTDVKAPAPSLAGAVIPPPKARTPLLKKLPPSLPGYSVGLSEEERQDLIVDLKPPVFPNIRQELEYFIAESKLPSAGVVNSVELGVGSAGNFQILYVKIDGAVQKNYVVQAYREPLENPHRSSKPVQMIEVQGEIEVQEKVNEQKNIYRAIVKKSLHPVRVGSFLTPGSLPTIDPHIVPVTNGAKANIIGGAYDNNRKLLMLHSYIFLDQGSTQGLEEGQCLTIYANESLRNSSQAEINDRNIGIVKVVKVTPSYATGYIVQAAEDIQTGDYAGGRPATTPGSKAVSKSKVVAPSDEFELDLGDDVESGGPEPSTGSGDEEFDF